LWLFSGGTGGLEVEEPLRWLCSRRVRVSDGADDADDADARDAADALGVIAWPADESEGMTARMVGRFARGSPSSSTFNVPALSFSYGVGDDRGVVPCENRLDVEGKGELLTIVSASEILVDVECRFAFQGCKGLGTRVSRGLGFNTALVPVLRSETREPLSSNVYPGAFRGRSIWEGWLGNGVFE
jgi:hypothetical protein